MSSPEPGKDRGLFETLTGLYFSPGTEFAAILARASFVKPLLVLIALNVAFTGLWTSKMDVRAFFTAQNEATKHWSETSREQKEQTLAVQEKIFRPFAWIAAFVGAPILIVVVAGFYNFLFRFFLASEVTFRQSLTIVAWAFLAVALVTTPLTTITMLLKGDWSIDPRNALQASLAIAFDPETTAKPLFTLARAMDVFVFWILFLLVAGYRAATSLRRGTVAAAIVVPWLLWILGQAALSLVF